MVAIEITNTGPEVDPLANQDVHPAAKLFPLMEGKEFDELVLDITTHGQREAIVMTPDGQLLDGRNRWRACAKAGITPITREETSEPWAYVISTNVHRRHLNESQRAMIGAKMADREPGHRRSGSSAESIDSADVPTRDEAAELLKVGTATITRARHLMKNGTVGLQDLVTAGKVPVYTAARVAESMPAEEQDEFAHRVENGADPKKLASALRVPSDYKPRDSTARSDNRSPSRHRHLGVSALQNLQASLDALAMVLNSVDGLDPALTPEEAAQWVGGLSKGRNTLSKVLTMLKERKESNP